MNREISNLADRLIQAGQIGGGDVTALRNAVWHEEAISLDTLDALFRVNDGCAAQSATWINFFIETVEHALLRQTPPQGFLDEDGARWLRAKIDRDGGLATSGEIALLVSILESAENAPEAVKAYVIAQIEATITSGVGPTRAPDSVRPGCVDEAEVELLRRLIFAGGGEGAVIVGAQEADMLFRIKDAALRSENAPDWLQLFVQGVGNHLMTHSDYRPLSREEAVRLHAEMEASTPSIAGFFHRMLPGDMLGRGTILDAFKAVFPCGEDVSSQSVSVESHPVLTAAEAAWLKTHIAADGQTDPYEKALMTFILDEIGDVPAPLADLGRRHA